MDNELRTVHILGTVVEKDLVKRLLSLHWS